MPPAMNSRRIAKATMNPLRTRGGFVFAFGVAPTCCPHLEQKPEPSWSSAAHREQYIAIPPSSIVTRTTLGEEVTEIVPLRVRDGLLLYARFNDCQQHCVILNLLR